MANEQAVFSTILREGHMIEFNQKGDKAIGGKKLD